MEPRRSAGDGSDRAADEAELAADLRTHEQQSDDGNDRDECKDECVFSQPLAPLVAADEVAEMDERVPELHSSSPPFRRSPVALEAEHSSRSPVQQARVTVRSGGPQSIARQGHPDEASLDKWTAGPRRHRRSESTRQILLDRGADLAQDRGDLAAQEDQGDDRNDGDEGEDQRVLGETLAFLVTTKERDKSSKHLGDTSFPSELPAVRAEATLKVRYAPVVL